METDLDGLDAGVAQRDAAARPLFRVDQLTARRIRQETVRAAPEELPDRLPGGLADQIPDGGLGNPRAPPVKVHCLSELADDLRAEGIEPDEERLERSAIRQVVSARPPREAVVGVNGDESRLLVIPRHRIPRGTERWVEGHPVAACLDRADPHHSPL